MRRLLTVLLFLAFASMAQAATTHTISGGGADKISAAITAAANGDTINITDNLTYTETALNITKKVFITADPGQTPTIRNAGALTANTFLTFGPGSGDASISNCAKFGSLSGGRITIEYQTQAVPAFADAVIRFKQGTSLHAILENVSIIETGTNAKINGMMHNYTTKEYITLNYVDIDLGLTTVLNWGTGAGYNQAAGIMGPADMNNYSGSQEVYNLNHVRIKNFGTVGICAQNRQMVLNMSYCDIGTLGATSNNPQWPAACIYSRHPLIPFTANIDRCIFRAPAVGCAVNFGGGGTASAYANPQYGSIPAYTSVTLTRSVFLSKYPDNKAGLSGSYLPGVGAGYGTVIFYSPRGSTGWTADRPQQIHFDHCDIIDLTTATYTNVACFARPSYTQENFATSLTLTNCNVYSANNAGLRNLASSTYPFSLTEDHNNWYSSQANSPATSGLNLDPGYLYPEAGDVRYSNTTLKTADSRGGPIGVDSGYVDVAADIFENRIGVRYAANPPAGGTIDGVTSTTYNINSGDSCPAKTAAANAHYTWGGWSDSNMSLSRTDTAITSSKIFKANFIIDTYTVTYAAAANGEVTGTLSQVIGWNENGTPVTALPSEGYHFTQWEDTLTSNPRIDFNVSANATHTASFAINTYNYNYVAGANGTVNGAASVTGTANHGASGPSVTAAPAAGFHFVKWLDNDSTIATRQDVFTADLNTTATFEADAQVTLTYTAGTGGSITGPTPQTVSVGSNGTEVVAVPNTGFTFVNWSDGVLTAARTDTNVTADINVTANFAVSTFTLAYTAGTGGSITGTSPQIVNYGDNGSQVTAVPDSGYHFVKWSDNVMTAARTDSNVTANISVTANFAADVINSIKVPTQYGTIQAAIDAASEGDTIEIINSATYSEELRIGKNVKIVATTGQTPKIQNSGTTNGVTILFLPGAGGAKIGSATGGRITIELLKRTVVADSVYNPANLMQFNHTTGTLVTVENCDMLETGTTAVAAINMMYHPLAIANAVTFDNVDINVNRTDAGGAYGFVIGTTTSIPSTPQGGPVYTLNRVRIRNYSRAGLWNNFQGTTINLNLCDFGVAGERQAALNYPWGGFISHQAAARFIGAFTNSVFRGGYNGAAVHIGGQGSSVSLSRCVLVNQMGNAATTAYGALLVGATSGAPSTSTLLRVSADHCDFVDLSVANANFGAIATRKLPEAGTVITTFSLAVTNSNIIAQSNPALFINLKTGDSFTSSYNNVFGAGANVGYTAGTGDLSMDPAYRNAATGDVRYDNNTLKLSDENGGAIGVNADYSDVYSTIVPGPEGVANRAHGWTTLK